MKTFFITIILTLSVNTANTQEIDPRLRLNNKDKIESIYGKNMNYYLYLLYELDESWSVKTKNELNPDQISSSISCQSIVKDSKTLTSSELIKGQFNWISWGILLSKDKETIIALENGTFLYFPSKTNINYAFNSSPFNRKN
jgi:hypothetical protein